MVDAPGSDWIVEVEVEAGWIWLLPRTRRWRAVTRHIFVQSKTSPQMPILSYEERASKSLFDHVVLSQRE